MAGNGEGPAIGIDPGSKNQVARKPPNSVFVPKNQGAGKPEAEGEKGEKKAKSIRSIAKGEEKRGRQAEKKNQGAGKPEAEGVKGEKKVKSIRSIAKGEEKRGRQAEKKNQGAGKPEAEGVKGEKKAKSIRSTAKGEEKRGRQAEKKNQGAGKPEAEGVKGEKKATSIRSTAKDEENGSKLFAADDKKEKEQIIVDMYRAVSRKKEEKLEVGGEEGRGWFLSKYHMHVEWVSEMMIELSKQGVNSIGDGDTDRRSMAVKAKNKRNGKLKKFWKRLLELIPTVIPALFGDPVSMVVLVFSLLCDLLQGVLTN